MSSLSSSSASSNQNWLADTGATSHMTPHRHWVHNYTPLRIPIRLADNRVIYSSGVGTVVFNPVIDGKRLQTLEFTKVLHVPELEKLRTLSFHASASSHFSCSLFGTFLTCCKL